MNQTEKVRQQIIFDILDGKYCPGDKLPTERDMAVLSGTSRITVRRAYEQLEQNGVIVRRPKHGTIVAENIRGNRQEIEAVGVITTLRDQFSRDFIESIHEACSERDALMILAIAENTAEQLDRAVKLAARGIRNIIVWGFDRSLDFSVFERIRALGMNIVFFDRVVPGPFADFVGLDNRDALNVMTADARANGIRNFVYADAAGLNVDSNAERLHEFELQCRKAEVPPLSFTVPWPLENNSEAADACRRFFRSHKTNEPTALFCVNDIMALAVLPGCPADVTVYSINGSEKAVAAGIKSYSQPVRQMATAAVDALEYQQKAGDKWQARKLHFKGKLLQK